MLNELELSDSVSLLAVSSHASAARSPRVTTATARTEW